MNPLSLWPWLTVSLLALAVSGYALWQVGAWKKQRQRLFQDVTPAGLEQTFVTLQDRLVAGENGLAQLGAQLEQLRQQQTFNIQKVGLVRFNPFGDGGGNFSFTLALLDSHDSGVILTSMHGREQNRIYSKKIIHGRCDTPLTVEEQRAIAQAGKEFTN